MLLKQRELNYYNDLFNTKANNVKNCWKEISRLCSYNTKKEHKGSIKKIIVNNEEFVSHKDIAGEFNKYFSTIAENLVKALPDTHKSYTDYMSSPISEYIFYTCCKIRTVGYCKQFKFEKSVWAG